MTALGTATVKVKTEWDERLPPLQVEVVSRRSAAGSVAFGIVLLISAAALMLAAPLAHDVVGSPSVHPGYLSCLAFLAALRFALAPFIRVTGMPRKVKK